MAGSVKVTGYAHTNLQNIFNPTFYEKGIESGLGGGVFSGRSLESFGCSGSGGAGDVNYIEDALAWSASTGRPVLGTQAYWLARTLLVPARAYLLAAPNARFVRKFGGERPGGGNYLVSTPSFDGTDYPGIRVEGGIWGPEAVDERLTGPVTVTFTNDGAMGTISFAGADAFDVGDLVLTYRARGVTNNNVAFEVVGRSGTTLSVVARARSRDEDNPDATIYPLAATVAGMTVRAVPKGGHVFRVESSNGLLSGISLIYPRGVQFFLAGDNLVAEHCFSDQVSLDGGGGMRVSDGKYFRGRNNNLNCSDDCYQFNPRAGADLQFGQFIDSTARTNQGSACAYIIGDKRIGAVAKTATLAHCRHINIVASTGRDDDRRGFGVKFGNGNGTTDIDDCWVEGLLLDQSMDNDEEIAAVRVMSGRSGFTRCGVERMALNDPVGTPLHIYQAEEVYGVTPSEQVDFTLRQASMSGPSRTTVGYGGANNAGPDYDTPPPFARVQGAAKLTLENIEADLGNGGAFIEIAKDYDGPGDWPTMPSVSQLVLRSISTSNLQPGVVEFDIGRRVGATLTDGRVGLGAASGTSAAVQEVAGVSYTLQPTSNGQTLRTTSDDPVTIVVPNNLRAGYECDVTQEGEGQVYFLHENGTAPEALDAVALSIGPDARVHVEVLTNSDGASARAVLSGDLAAVMPGDITENITVTATVNTAVSPLLAGQGIISRISDDDYAAVDPFLQAVIDAKVPVIRWPGAGGAHDGFVDVWHFDIDHTIKGIGSYTGPRSRDLWDPEADLATYPPAPREEMVTLETICGVAAAAGARLMVPLDFRRAWLKRDVGGVRVGYKPPLGYAYDDSWPGVPLTQPQIDALTPIQHFKNELARMLKAFSANGVTDLMITTGENSIGFELEPGQFPWLPDGGDGTGGGGDDVGEDDPIRNEWIAINSVEFYTYMASVAAGLGMTLDLGFSVQVGKSTKTEFPMTAPHIANRRVAIGHHVSNLGPVTQYITLKAEKYRLGWDAWTTDDVMAVNAMTDSGQAGLPELKTYFEGFCAGLGQGQLKVIIHEYMVFETMAGVPVPTSAQGAIMTAQGMLLAGGAGMETIVGYPGFAGERASPGFQTSRALTRDIGGVLTKTPLHGVQRIIGEACELGPNDMVLSGAPSGLYAACWKYAGGCRLFLINKQPVARSILVDISGASATAVTGQYRQGLEDVALTGVGAVEAGDVRVELTPYSFASVIVTLT